MNYILIDSKTRAPVPLPFSVVDVDGDAVTITNAKLDDTDPMIELRMDDRDIASLDGWYHIDLVKGLELITEADFMAERS